MLRQHPFMAFHVFDRLKLFDHFSDYRDDADNCENEESCTVNAQAGSDACCSCPKGVAFVE